MENAIKALLIAAGVLFALMVLSLLLVAYNQISDYYNEESDLTQIEQLAEFNQVFENYHRNNIRGSELLSLMNRIIDYNERQSYAEGTNYKRIGVTITLGGTAIRSQFKYEINNETVGNTILKSNTITNKTGTSRTDDNKLTAITQTETNLISKGSSIGVSNLTGTQLQKLSSNISNIILSDSLEKGTDQDSKTIKEKRAQLLTNILGVTIKSSNTDKIKKIQQMTSEYYQFTQFKRAYFNCTDVIYDEITGRVWEMNFTLVTKNGQVIFN